MSGGIDSLEVTAAALAEVLYDAGPAGIVLYEPAPPFRVLATNRAYQELWPEPLRSRGLVGLGLAEYVPGAEERGIVEAFREVARTGVARRLEEFAYDGLPGGTRWFTGTLSPLRRDGRVLALAHMAVDVTREVRARKEAERALEESRHAAELLELGDPFCELDREFRVVRVNAAHERVNGHRREEILGRTHWDVWPESADPTSPYWSEYHRCMAERVRVEFDAHYGPLDLWTSVSAYPTAQGGIAIFWRDATRRKRTEDALARATERLADVLNSIQDDFYVLDREWRFTFASRSFTSRVGKAPEDFVGRCIWTMFPAHVGTEYDEHLRAAMERSETRRFEIQGRYTDAWYRMTAFPSKDGITVLGVEITESRRMEGELRALNARLLEADRRKDEFLRMLSHELRNPLAPLRNASYVLRHADPGSDAARRARDVIERQTGHVARLVDDLLDVTRIARGKIELRRATADLREIVRRAAEDFHLVMEERGIAFRAALPDGHLAAEVDAVRVTQVVGNLLHNAAKFTGRGGAVTLSLRRDGADAVIAVRDTGAGIDPDLLPSVFDPFVQGERTLARTEGGLGLGLALVKGVVELHGGAVSVASAGRDQGAEFLVRLPLGAGVAAPAAPPHAEVPVR